MRTLSTLAFALVACGLGSVANAQGWQPLDPGALQRSCPDLSNRIGTITTKYTYKNWEGIMQTKEISFAPVNGRCITDQPRWSMSFSKSSAGAPPYELVLNFQIDSSDRFVLQETPKTGDCYERTSLWFIDYYKKQNAVMTQQQIDAMRNNVRTQICPSISRAVATSIINKINGN